MSGIWRRTRSRKKPKYNLYNLKLGDIACIDMAYLGWPTACARTAWTGWPIGRITDAQSAGL